MSMNISLMISDYPDAVKIQDQVIDSDGVIKQFAVYRHPKFYRWVYQEKTYSEYAPVFNGEIVITPTDVFNIKSTQAYKELADVVLAL